VWAWRVSCSKRYQDLQEAYADTKLYSLNYFDDIRSEITFNAKAPVKVSVDDDDDDDDDKDDDWMNCPLTFEELRDPVRLGSSPYHFEVLALPFFE
jgi:hypothetical protein